MCQTEEFCAQADEGTCHCMSREQSSKGRKVTLQASPEGALVVPLSSQQAPAKRKPSRGARASQDGRQGELGLESGISTSASSRDPSVSNSTHSPGPLDSSRDSFADHLHDTHAGLKALKQTIKCHRLYEKAPCHTMLDQCAEAGKSNWSSQLTNDGRSGNAQIWKQDELRKVTRDMLLAKANSVEARDLASKLDELKSHAGDQLIPGRPTPPCAKQHLESPRLSRPRALPALLSPPQLKKAETYAAEAFDTKKRGCTQTDQLKGSMTLR